MTRRFFIVCALLLCFVTLSFAITPADNGKWIATGSLLAARQNAAAVALPDGRVLVTGGRASDGSVLATTEIIQADGSAIAGPAMGAPRAGHTATLLADGTVLIIGGDSGAGATVTAERFDPNANVFTPLAATLSDARTGHVAALDANGNVTIIGGTTANGPVMSVESFDVTTQRFVNIGRMMYSRSQAAIAAFKDGRVLIAGGVDANGVTLASTEIFDPSTAASAAGPTMNVARAGATATLQIDGNIIVIGGTTPDAQGSASELASGELFAADGSITAIATVLNVARTGHTAFLLPQNAGVLVVGGQRAGANLNSAELYQPWTGTATLSTMAATHVNGAGAAKPGVMAVAGGANQFGIELFGFPTLFTDKLDYAPTESVWMQGGGWLPNEAVSLYMQAIPSTANVAPTITTTADAAGNISDGTWAPDPTDIGARLYVTAVGSSSGWQAQTTFTDANVNTSVSSSLNPSTYGQSVTLTASAMQGSNPVTCGTIRFQDGGTGLGSAVSLDGSGHASISLTTLSATSHSITAVYTGTGCGNANKTNTALLQTVNRAALTVTASGDTKPYGTTRTYGSGSTAFAASGLQNGETIGTVTITASGGTAAIDPVGNYTLTPSAATGGTFAATNYNISYATGTLSVTPASQSITVTQHAPTSAAYNQQFTVAATASSGLAVTYTSSGGCTNTGATFTITSGTTSCTVKYDQSGNSNYVAATQVSETVTAGKVTPTITWAAPAAITYGTPLTATQLNATVDGGIPGSLVYTPAGGAVLSAGPQILNVAFTPTDTTNYNATNVSVSLTVNPAALTVTADAKSKTYDGAPYSPFTVSYSGFVNGENASVLGGTLSFSGSAVGAIDAGSYTINPGGLTSSNYSITFQSAYLGIGQASVLATAGSYSGTYDAAAHAVPACELSGSYLVGLSCTNSPASVGPNVGSGTILPVVSGANSNFFVVTYSGSYRIDRAPAFPDITPYLTEVDYDGSPKPVVVASTVSYVMTYTGVAPTVYPTSSIPPTNPGNYDVQATVTDPNYYGSASGKLTINQLKGYSTLALLAGMPDPSPYGSMVYFQLSLPTTPCPTGQVTFYVDSVAVQTVNLPASNCTQPLEFKTATLSPDFHVILASYAGDSIYHGYWSNAVYHSVNPNATSVTLAATSNTVNVGQTVTFTATVNPANAVDGSAQAPTGDVQFLDNGVVIGTGALSATAPYIATFTTSLAAGSHNITASYLGASGYDGNSSAVVVETVNKIVPEISWTPARTTFTYGTMMNELILNATASYGGNPVPGSFTYDVNLNDTLPTGTRNVTATFVPTDPDLYASATAIVTFTVQPRTLMITAQNQSRPVGVANPTLTYDITGFVNGDDQSVLTGAPVLTTTADISSPAGNYPIIVTTGDLAATNYTFGVVNGTLTVVQGTQSITINQPAPLSAAFNSQFTVSATASSGLAVQYSSAGGCTNVGPLYTMTSGTIACSVKIDQPGDTNYSAAPQVVTSVAATLANQATLNLTGVPTGAQGFGAVFTVGSTGGSGTGLVTYAATGSCSASGTKITVGNVAGTCSVTATKAADSNYNSVTSATANVTVMAAGVDFVEASVSVPATAVAGGTMFVTETAINQGITAASSTSLTYLYLSRDGVTKGSVVGTRSVPKLAAGASSGPVTTTVSIPTNTVGAYYILACANATSTATESNTTNNCTASSTAFNVAGPDLLVTTVTVPASVGAGATLQVTDTTGNQGGGAAPASATYFYLSLDGVTKGTNLGTRNVPSLAVGAASGPVNTNITVPLNSVGSYYILACANGNSAVVETNTANNCLRSATVVSVVGPDLVETNVSVPASAPAGGSIQITDTANNSGAGIAGASSTYMYLSRDGVTKGTLLGARSVPQLVGGGSSTGSVTLAIPTNSIGTYYVIACANGNSGINESNTANNCTASNAFNVAAPDLTESNVTVTGTFVAGSSITISDTAQNIGGGTAASSLTYFYLSIDGVTKGSILGGRSIGTLAPNASSTVSNTKLTLPTNISGGYYVLACANATSTVVESDTTNNCSVSARFNVTK